MEKWKKLSWAECDECGSDDIEVKTSNKKEDWVYDGDDVRCTECGQKGAATCDGEGGAYIHWIYE